LYWFLCLFLRTKVRCQKPTGMTVRIVSTCQMFANFSNSRDCFLIWCRKMCIKNVQHSLINWGLHFFPLPPFTQFHHSSSIIYFMFFVVKSVSFDHSSCIYHPFSYWIINLFMWVMYRAIWVIYSSSSRWQLVILLGYLFYVRPFWFSCVMFAVNFITRFMCEIWYDCVLKNYWACISSANIHIAWLLIDVMLCCSSESFCKSKVKGKRKRVSANVLVEL